MKTFTRFAFVALIFLLALLIVGTAGAEEWPPAFTFTTLLSGTTETHFHSLGISGDTALYPVNSQILSHYAHDVGYAQTQTLQTDAYIPQYGNASYQHYAVIAMRGNRNGSDQPSEILRLDRYTDDVEVLVPAHDFDRYLDIALEFPYLIYVHDYMNEPTLASLLRSTLDLYDLRTGETSIIAEVDAPSYAERQILTMTSTDGQHVVYVKCLERFCYNSELWAYDIATGENTLLVAAPEYETIWWTGVQNEIVVYTQRTLPSMITEIRGIDLATGERWLIADEPTFQGVTQMDGDYVVWESYEPPGGCPTDNCSDMYWEENIYLHDLVTGQTVRVTNAPGREFFPEIQGDRIVYVSQAGQDAIMELQLVEFIARPPAFPDGARAEAFCASGDGTLLLDETLVRADAPVSAATFTFPAVDPDSEVVLCIQNGDTAGEYRTRQAAVWVNGYEVVDGGLFNPQFEAGALFLDFASDHENGVAIEVGDVPGSRISVQIREVGANLPPVADAGPDFEAHAGESVSLDGSASYDPDDDLPLQYFWMMLSSPEGSSAVLITPGTGSPTVTFTPDIPGDYTFELVVRDQRGADSAPDTVVLHALNEAPVADAGPDQAVLEPVTIVHLDGSQSYDLDGDPLIYHWTVIAVPPGSAAALDDPASATPTFTADLYGTYEFELQVIDPWATSPPDIIVVSVDNVAPVANAGQNQAVSAGDTVLLDGSGSADANGDPLTYAWSITAMPEGSAAVLADPTAAQTSFIADVSGTYTVQLIVNDGLLDSEPSQIAVVATALEEEVIEDVDDVIVDINELDPDVFKNGNRQHALSNKLDAVIALIEDGEYEEARNKLEHDILGKTDGCAVNGEPDRNDWIQDCEAQAPIYDAIMDILDMLDSLP